MTSDARFEDGGEKPLRLSALDAADLEVLSSLIQDAVFPVTEMTWDCSGRRFAVLLNRFRWEERDVGQARGRAPERVQSMLVVSDVQSVASQGVQRGDVDTVLSLLSVGFEPGEDGQGAVLLTLAGDGAVRLAVECLDITLTDVTKPYIAPSGRAPSHPD